MNRLEVNVGRRDALSFQNFLTQWRRSRRGAAAVLASTDGRWAIVSTSITVLVAGAIAWLAAGTVPQPVSYGPQATGQRSLLPYQLFMRMVSGDKSAQYAAIGPTAPIADKHAATDRAPAPSALDHALTAQSLNAQDDSKPGIETRKVTMSAGDTLVGTLMDAGIDGQEAHAAVVALRKVFNPRSLRAGQSFKLAFAPAEKKQVATITYTPPNGAGASDSTDDADTSDAQPSAQDAVGRLLSISFSPTIDHEITVTRAANGAFSAKDTQRDLVAQYHRAGGTIDSSLYLAAMRAGIPANVVVEMIHMFSYQVDFQRDIHPGDKFQVLYSYYYTPEGKAAKEGVISYASMTLGGKTMVLYRYEPKDGTGVDYLDAHGRSAKSLLMRTPVDGARISSGFGMRYHPVLGYTRMHKGVDFAVPVGTPVMAAGNGVIKYEGRARGYGNFLLIKHNRKYSTAYAHLSRFAKGLHDGSHVRQGQIVAYSGNTGLTTGPHLHYEVRIYGKQVNPMTVKIAKGVKLKGKALQAFEVQRLKIDQELASLPLETRVAQNASNSGLRAGSD